MRRNDSTTHREFIRAISIDEVVAWPCTCARGGDHWYREAKRPAATAGEFTPDAGVDTHRLRSADAGHPLATR